MTDPDQALMLEILRGIREEQTELRKLLQAEIGSVRHDIGDLREQLVHGLEKVNLLVDVLVMTRTRVARIEDHLGLSQLDA